MFQATRSNLGRRILFLVAVSVLLVLAGLGFSGWQAVRQSSEQVFNERQALAEASVSHLDYVLRENMERLSGIAFSAGVDIEDDNIEPEKRALHSAYLGSIFNNGVFIADLRNTVIWVEPYRQEFIGANISGYPPLQARDVTKPSVSGVFKAGLPPKDLILAVSPLRNSAGKLVGLVGGLIDPAGRSLPVFSQPAELGRTSYIDSMDANGVILASSDASHLLQKSLDGNDKMTIATKPADLAAAPWFVVIGQAKEEALAPARAIQQRFITFGSVAVALALLLGWGMARSLVKPLGKLTAAAETISRGNLEQPVPQLGSDEIGKLSQGFDSMRIALRNSLEEIQTWNRALESKVEERTRQLEESNREIKRKGDAHEELLRKVLTIQEEERRRIARELHDETSQALVGLVMRVEALRAAPQADGKVQAALEVIKALTVRTIDNVHKIIFDLRPSVLDDLGLLSAIRWYASNRLEPLGVRASVEITGEEWKLPSHAEIALFRVAQEAINNIVRHAEAQNVIISIEFKERTVVIEIEDDGKGFDVDAIELIPDKAQGVGLLGMKERMGLLGGRIRIVSQPGGGTHITVEAPL